MLTDKDLNRIVALVATKDDVRRIFDERLEPVHEVQQRILSAVDSLATVIVTQNLENAARDTQLSRHDDWIHKIANKTKVSLKD